MRSPNEDVSTSRAAWTILESPSPTEVDRGENAVAPRRRRIEEELAGRACEVRVRLSVKAVRGVPDVLRAQGVGEEGKRRPGTECALLRLAEIGGELQPLNAIRLNENRSERNGPKETVFRSPSTNAIDVGEPVQPRARWPQQQLIDFKSDIGADHPGGNSAPWVYPLLPRPGPSARKRRRSGTRELQS
ncbi:MAG: hypothetical protein M1831_005515 [Alyxoria varia]|nr:MAG: hypothetical protein M1831_005515 [Alyxoria varia]